MDLAQRLIALAAESDNFASLAELFWQVNVRLFTRFQNVQHGKRVVTKLVSGVVTFGSAPPPIALYEWPTARKQIKGKDSATLGPPSRGMQSHPHNRLAPVGRVTR